MAQPTTQVIANRYQLNHTIGAGGMGAVYRAFDRLTQTHVALKQVHVPLSQVVLSSFSDGGETHQLALTREFQTLASLRHPNIISVLDYGFYDDAQTSQTPFFTMELLNKPVSLHDAATDLHTTVNLIAQILQALTYLHRRDIIHRDLKPGNVLVHDDRVRVLDFGLSVTTETARGHGGTLPYMPPEQLTRGIITMQGDLYTVGIIAYELLAGHLPFESQNLTAKLRGQADMQAVNAPDAVRDVIAKLLQRQPQDRYASATDARRALLQAIGDDVPPEDVTVRESFLQAAAFVGRDDELKTLQTAFETVAQGGVALYLVGGESGVGKTRLLDELRIQAMVSGALVVRGQAATDGLTFQVWRNIAPHLLLEVDVSDTQAQILKDIVPNAANLLNKPVDEAPALSGQAYVQRLGLTLVDIIKQMQRPLVLLLEDLHWATGDLAILKQVLQVSDQLHHLMIIGTYRSDEAPALPDDLNGMATLQLERLSPVYIKALSASMLGEQGTQENVLELLERETEGNIFFLVETVRALAEEVGSLERVGLTTLPDHVFTGKMQQLMQRRLNKIDDRYQPLQQLAAVLGREIDMALLAQRYDRQMIDDWLIRASEVAVLDVLDNRWRFAHDKLREATLIDLPDDERAIWHRTAAETIETVYPNNDDYNEALLEHWHQAGDLNQELHYLPPVARRLIDIGAKYQPAFNLLQRSLNALPPDDGRRVQLLNLQATTHELQGQHKQMRDLAQQAYDLAQQHDDQHGIAESLTQLGLAAVYYEGDYAKARTYHEQSLVIRQERDDTQGISQSLSQLGIVSYYEGNYAQARDYFQQGLSGYEKTGDQRAIATNTRNIGSATSELGDQEQALVYYQQSLAIFRQIGDQHNAAIVFNNMGNIAYMQHDYTQAHIYFQQSHDIFKAVGARVHLAFSLHNLGRIAYMQADYAQARDYYHASYVMRNALGDPFGSASTLKDVALARLHLGEEGVFEQLVEALTIAHGIPSPYVILQLMIAFARYHLLKDNPYRAAEFVGLVQAHVPDNPTMQVLVDQILPDFAGVISDDDLQTALERGQKLELDTLVRDLLVQSTVTTGD